MAPLLSPCTIGASWVSLLYSSLRRQKRYPVCLCLCLAQREQCHDCCLSAPRWAGEEHAVHGARQSCSETVTGCPRLWEKGGRGPWEEWLPAVVFRWLLLPAESLQGNSRPGHGLQLEQEHCVTTLPALAALDHSLLSFSQA